MKTKKKVKARKILATYLTHPNPRYDWRLPATPEAYEQMVNQVGPQIQRWLNGYALPTKYPTVAHAVLAAIGITIDDAREPATP